jgi:hypothetical protein
MSNSVFPAFNGQGWSVFKRPTLSTRRIRSKSGRSVRMQDFAQALWEFELTFEVLSDSATPSAVGAQTYQTLEAFWLAIVSTADTFLFNDPNDNTVTAQVLGVADGVQTQWTLTRTIAGPSGVTFTEPVGQAYNLVPTTNGVTQTAGFAFVAPNVVQFTTAPTAGTTIGASFMFWFVCEFLDDVLDMENIMETLWQLGSLKFQSVKL